MIERMNLLSLLAQEPVLFFILVAALILSLSTHEFAHALAANLLGDTTAERAGRLTLNPLAHLDPLGFLAILTVGFGWAKPVPFNPYNLRDQKWGPALVGLAGPASNFVFGTLCALLVGLFLPSLGISNLLILALSYLGLLNYGLMIFNAIPLAPLDGSKLLDVFLAHPKYASWRMWLEARGPSLLLMLVLADAFLHVGIFSWIPRLSAGLFDFVTRIV
jgi:Zn-dependent protease